MAKYNRIRDLREDSDKTQSEIAEYLGTSTQHYGKYENGRAEIPFDRAIMLAKYYNVSLDYIAGLTKNRRKIPENNISEKERELLNEISSLSREEKEKFYRIINTMLNI